MKGLPFVLLFTAMTFIAWGAYGPTLHHGANALNHDSLRAFVGVGLAYFLIAVLIPLLILKRSGEVGRWTLSGAIYSLIAGAVGAVGALGIIMALGYGGATLYVMPLVFGLAPVVNTLVTAYMSKTFHEISPVFMAGVIAAALGAGGVIAFKPAPGKLAAASVDSGTHTAPHPPNQESDSTTNAKSATVPSADAAKTDAATETSHKDSTANDAASPPSPPAKYDSGEKTRTKTTTEPASQTATTTPKRVNYLGVFASIIVAALCWGSYGPMLHIGQGKMSGSRLRPFTCVGLAYFFIAVAAPLALIYSKSGDVFGGWTTAGLSWSFLAGVAGAVGALGVLLAFNAGGKPYYVMPLIFGFAPVINTFISLSEAGTWALVPTMFWVSLGVVIAGAVTVLMNAPKPKPKPQAAH